MKKTVLAIAAAATIGLAGYHVTNAQAHGPGYGMMGPGYGQQQTLDPATQKTQDKFFKETTELRRQMAAKWAEMHALMSGTNPDGQKAAKLAEEMFDLREQLRTKAREAGLPMGFGGGFCGGPGAGGGMMGMGGGMMGMGAGHQHRGW